MNTKLTPQDIKRYNGYIWKFFIGCFAFLVIMIVSTMLGVFGPLPLLSDLEHPKSDQAPVAMYSLGVAWESLGANAKALVLVHLSFRPPERP